MSRALLTFATGSYAPLLDLSWPGLNEYAARHGYELVDEPPALLTRPPAWGKVKLLLTALADHEEALWVDSDVLVLDAGRDIADEIPADAWQALTRHHTREGEIASSGVWYVRRQMRAPLERIWRMTRYLNHPWWEQAALQEVLGYDPLRRPVTLEKPTVLFERTHWLGIEWNALALQFPSGNEEIEPSRARFVHCGPGSSPQIRVEIMQSLIEGSTANEQVPA